MDKGFCELYLTNNIKIISKIAPLGTNYYIVNPKMLELSGTCRPNPEISTSMQTVVQNYFIESQRGDPRTSYSTKLVI